MEEQNQITQFEMEAHFCLFIQMFYKALFALLFLFLVHQKWKNKINRKAIVKDVMKVLLIMLQLPKNIVVKLTLNQHINLQKGETVMHKYPLI